MTPAIGLLLGLFALVAFAAAEGAKTERRDRHALEREFRAYLHDELGAARLRTAQVELMLDSRRAAEYDLPTPAERDGHLLVHAPALQAPGRARAESAPIHSLELSVDALPDALRQDVRAIEGEDLQREYVETIQRELAGGADVAELRDRLFGG